jgi:hypothetical protein
MLSGCATEFSQDNPKPPASAVSSRWTWKAQGDLRDPARAIDGLLSTAAVSDADYVNAALTIDLGKPCVLNLVVIHHGPDEYGFCKRVAMATSMDGTSFIERYAGAGARHRTSLLLLTPTLARYIRLQAIVPGSQPWSVGEVFVQ